MKYSLFVLVPFLFFTNCKTQQQFMPENNTTRILCGTYLAENEEGLVASLQFKDWNTVSLTTPFDDLSAAYVKTPGDPVRPDSRYFIKEDTLYLEMDKGYLCYAIKEDNALIGLTMWVEGDRLFPVENGVVGCPETHVLTEEDAQWLRHSQQYYEVYYSHDRETAMPIAQQLCEEGYGPACMTLGMNLFMKDQEQSFALLEKACEIGYFGSYACYRYGEILNQLGRKEEAKKAYRKAFKGGHAVAGMAIALMQN